MYNEYKIELHWTGNRLLYLHPYSDIFPKELLTDDLFEPIIYCIEFKKLDDVHSVIKYAMDNHQDFMNLYKTKYRNNGDFEHHIYINFDEI